MRHGFRQQFPWRAAVQPRSFQDVISINHVLQATGSRTPPLERVSSAPVPSREEPREEVQLEAAS